MRPIQHVAEALAQRGHPACERSFRNRVGTRRDVHRHALMHHHLLCPVEVVRVADQKAAVHVVGVHDDSDTLRGLVSIVALGFGDQIYIRDAACLQIIAANLAFAEVGIFARTTSSDNDGGQSALEKVVSMVQARAIHRRRMAHVLRRAEHHDGIGGTGLIHTAFAHDLPTGVQQKPHRNDGGYGYDPAGKWRVGVLYRRGAYSWPPKSSRICSSGMAPCRITRHLPSLRWGFCCTPVGKSCAKAAWMRPVPPMPSWCSARRSTWAILRRCIARAWTMLTTFSSADWPPSLSLLVVRAKIPTSAKARLAAIIWRGAASRM